MNHDAQHNIMFSSFLSFSIF